MITHPGRIRLTSPRRLQTLSLGVPTSLSYSQTAGSFRTWKHQCLRLDYESCE